MNLKHLYLNIIIFVIFANVKVSQTVTGTCVCNSDCNNHGQCINSACVCDNGYITYDSGACNYKQKEKLTAFLLSFLIGATGADWFYLSNGNAGYIVAGVFKLLTGLVCCIEPFFVCCMKSDNGRGVVAIAGMIIMTIIVLANAIWVLADWIRVLAGTFPDGNGLSLKDW